MKKRKLAVQHAGSNAAEAAVKLRAMLTHIQIMDALLASAQADGRKAIAVMPVCAEVAPFLTKVGDQICHVLEELGRTRKALPSEEELLRHIQRLHNSAVPMPDAITGDLGDKVRTHDHGSNVRKPQEVAA